MPSEASSVADLTNSGRCSRRGTAEALAATKHGELRRRNAMECQQLLAQHLVARQQQAARIAAGIGCAHQLEKRHHVLIVGDDAVELLEQVEHDLRLPLDQRRAQLGQRVEHAEASAPRGRRRAASRPRRTRCATRRFPCRCSLRGSPAAAGSLCTTTSVRSGFMRAGAVRGCACTAARGCAAWCAWRAAPRAARPCTYSRSRSLRSIAMRRIWCAT